MSLTRTMLKAMGIEPEKIDEIINAHGETVNALKEQRDQYKDDAAKLVTVQKKLDEANKKLEDVDTSELEEKYNTLKNEYDTYKKDQTAKETKATKTNAYRELLKEIGISDKRLDTVLKVSDIDGVEIVDGKIKDADKLKESLKTEWGEFIPVTTTKGTDTANPPTRHEGGMTKEQIMAITDKGERRKAIAANMELFE